MKPLFYIFLISLFQVGFIADKKEIIQKNEIKCSENGCTGIYSGPEFIEGKDIAHQFSNKMSKAVGDQLKELYHKQQYKRVNFSKIKMSTQGMGSGKVIYKLSIPFIAVNSKCDAYTSFDHVGGWDHEPDLKRRKYELRNVTLKGHHLAISQIQKTPEGLQEYWIQWKNKTTQSDCK